MKNMRKLLVTVVCICLTFSCMLMGVFAAGNKNVSVIGTISFVAKNISATISGRMADDLGNTLPKTVSTDVPYLLDGEPTFNHTLLASSDDEGPSIWYVGGVRFHESSQHSLTAKLILEIENLGGVPLTIISNGLSPMLTTNMEVLYSQKVEEETLISVKDETLKTNVVIRGGETYTMEVHLRIIDTSEIIEGYDPVEDKYNADISFSMLLKTTTANEDTYYSGMYPTNAITNIGGENTELLQELRNASVVAWAYEALQTQDLSTRYGVFASGSNNEVFILHRAESNNLVLYRDDPYGSCVLMDEFPIEGMSMSTIKYNGVSIEEELPNGTGLKLSNGMNFVYDELEDYPAYFEYEGRRYAARYLDEEITISLHWFRVEAIAWQIVQNGTVFKVISKDALFARPFDSYEGLSVSWENCDTRKFLSYTYNILGLYKVAPHYSVAIDLTTIYDPTYGDSYEVVTSDHMYIPSLEDIAGIGSMANLTSYTDYTKICFGYLPTQTFANYRYTTRTCSRGAGEGQALLTNDGVTEVYALENYPIRIMMSLPPMGV